MNGTVSVFQILNADSEAVETERKKLFEFPLGSMTFAEVRHRVLSDFMVAGESMDIQIVAVKEGEMFARLKRTLSLHRGET